MSSTFARAATAVALVLVLAIGACTTVPPPLPAFTPFAEPAVGLDQRAAQIRRAALGLGWMVTDAAPGRIELRRDDSMATVDFTERNFVTRPMGLDPAIDELRRSIVVQSGF